MNTVNKLIYLKNDIVAYMKSKLIYLKMICSCHVYEVHICDNIIFQVAISVYLQCS